MKRATPKIRILMTVDHDWKVPGKRSWIAFRAGREYPVTQAQHDDLVPAYAVRITNGNR